MAGHDLRQNLQIILHTYGRLASCATSGPERECIARGQRAVMQMAEQLHQLVTASQIHQKTSQIALAPVRLSSLLSTIDKDTNKFASEQAVRLCGSDASGGRKRSSPVGERDWQSYTECREIHRGRREGPARMPAFRAGCSHRGSRHGYRHSFPTSQGYLRGVSSP
jgi:hypothetical protein